MRPLAGHRPSKILGVDRGTFYRQVRALHGYLSAVSFVLLMAFSATGILLNHPGWFASTRSATEDRTIALDGDAVARALRSEAPPRRLADLVAGRVELRGAYKSGEIVGAEASLRFEGVTGATDVSVDLGTGSTEVSIRRASLVQTLNDLHRGKNAGAAWGWVIDVSAGLILAMSVLGYAIFLSLRSRLRSALALTAIGLVAVLGIYGVLVP